MTGHSLIRVAAVALALSTLSFAAGVAGDLSNIDPPRSGERVVLRLPPEIPADAPRAAPLPPMISTSAAEAREPAAATTPAPVLQPAAYSPEPEARPAPPEAIALEPLPKHRQALAHAEAKPGPRAAKPNRNIKS